MPHYLHPSERGYQVWADSMEPMIRQLLGEWREGRAKLDSKRFVPYSCYRVCHCEFRGQRHQREVLLCHFLVEGEAYCSWHLLPVRAGPWI